MKYVMYIKRWYQRFEIYRFPVISVPRFSGLKISGFLIIYCSGSIIIRDSPEFRARKSKFWTTYLYIHVNKHLQNLNINYICFNYFFFNNIMLNCVQFSILENM